MPKKTTSTTDTTRTDHLADSSAALKTQLKKGPVELPQLKRAKVTIYLMGDTPLIVHAWSQKAIIQMLAKQMGEKLPRFPRSPVRDFLDSIYRLKNGDYGFPATGAKRALTDACTSMGGELGKTLARQAFSIYGEEGNYRSALTGAISTVPLLRIASPEPPRMREDAVRIGAYSNRVATLAYRAEFHPWALKFDLIYNALVVSRATAINVMDTAGFAVGFGEWRQEKGGIYGSCHLADPSEIKLIDKWAAMPHKEPVLPDEQAFRSSLRQQIEQYGEATDDEVADALSTALAKNASPSKPVLRG